MEKQSYTPVEPQALDEINLLDRALQNCPYPAYRMLRDQAPVWLDPITGFYVITRFEDLRGALLDPARFASGMQGGQQGSIQGYAGATCQRGEHRVVTTVSTA